MTDTVVADATKTVVSQPDRYHSGLDGKDAAFLAANFNAQADRAIIDAVRDEGRHGIDVTHTTSKSVELAVEKTAAAGALATATAELRLSKEILKEACETRDLIRAEAQTTRDLINSNENQRLRDQIAAQNATLVALRVQLGQPVV